MSLTQKQLDKEMVESGKARYWRTQSNAVNGERESDTDLTGSLSSVHPV